MIEVAIAGFGALRLKHLVLDYNGTVAVDGRLLPGVPAALKRLSRRLEIHVLTADTFGGACAALARTQCRLHILPSREQHRAKLAYVKRLGVGQTACIGNGRNDRLMLKSAALGIAVVQAEGAASEAIEAADVVVPGISAALGLLENPLRLIASLRS